MGEGVEMIESKRATMEVMEEARRDLEEVDDDGKPRRTGTVWTASAHIITAVIGSGVLSLGWAMAQLGWIAGPLALFLFSVVTFFTSSLLTDCYRTGDPQTGKRNYTYMQAVKSNLDSTKYWLCGLAQNVNLVGTSIGYTITASISGRAISKANCFHYNGLDADCKFSETWYMVSFGIVQIFLSQLPNFHELWWLSIVAAVMSFTYSFIAIGLSIARIASGTIGSTSITGVAVGEGGITPAGKVWSTFQALGDIAFAYSYSMILIEIEDTVKSPPAENKLMRRANLIGVSTTTLFYFMCGVFGYVAFGNNAPGNIMTDFGFYEPFWLVDFANFCIIVHLVGAFQVYAQPLYAAFETMLLRKYPDSKFLTYEKPLIRTKYFKFSLNFFRLIWRTIFVIVVTVIATSMPFFNDIVGLLGAIGFWPLTVYFPIEMYIAQKKVRKFSRKWVLLKTLSGLCFLVTVSATCGSIQGVTESLKHFVPFQTKS